MRILSLNIRHGGGQRIDAITDYVKSIAPSAVVLTEFRNGRSGERLRLALAGLGLVNQLTPDVQEQRTNSVLIAASVPIVKAPLVPPASDAHRIVACSIGGLVLCGVYFALREAKMPLFDFLLEGPAELRHGALLVGDFNTGFHFLDEKGATFIGADRFARLKERGLVDLWRRQNGENAREYSWFSQTAGNGFRIDHALATADVAPRIVSCQYDHSTRGTLTDHSALIIDLE